MTTLARRERSLGWLARKAKVSTSLMWFVSRGERTLAMEKAIAVAKALGEEVDYLFVSKDAIKMVAEVAA